jgi:high-affinity nickel permease
MGDIIIIGVFLASFFLGIKHSLDVDHVAAVSTLLLRSPRITQTIKMAIFWSLGHTLTAGILTIILFLMKDVFLSSFLAGFELIIAIMLIIIGIITIIFESNVIKVVKKPHSHHFHFFKKNRHASHSTSINGQEGNGILKPEPKGALRINNSFVAITLIGILQGLASNDELLIILAFTLNLNNLLTVLVGIVLFSFGVAVGMIAWSSLLNLPKIKGKQEKIIKWLNISIAIIAIVYGIYLLLGGEGINLIAFLG